jgi:hypothetical protein
MLNARASRSSPLVLLIIPVVVVAPYVVLSGVNWAVLAVSSARFLIDGLLIVSVWLPLLYVISVEGHIDNRLMPVSNRDGSNPIDRIDWRQIVKLGTGREPAPRSGQPRKPGMHFYRNAAKSALGDRGA